MDLQLSGRRVLVTGGTRGIGRAVVEAFLGEGAVADRGTVRGTAVDVGDGTALATWVEQSAAAFGGLDLVVDGALTRGIQL